MTANDKTAAGSPKRSNLRADQRVGGCNRCGTCCRKGGPGLHRADRRLIEEGDIPGRHLYTIRPGELAWDNVQGGLLPAASDIIKIKSRPGTDTCFYFEAHNNACRIYENRPLECRAMQCWDTREIERIYATDRLTRKDLLQQIKGLWELVEAHQQRCDDREIRRLVKALDGRQKAAVQQKIAAAVDDDAQLRKRVVARGALDPEMLDFLFGRPLTDTLEALGIKVRREGERIILSRPQRR